MFSLYARVAGLAGRRGLAAWPAAFSLVVYGLIAWGAAVVAAPLGFVGGFLLTFVWAACWSSYLELISQAVEGTKIRLRVDDLRRTFLTRFWDVVSVMFAFWIIGFLAKAVTSGANGDALGAILGFAMAFFFNAVPELLYQGGSRSFALLLDSGRFMTAHYLVWLPPNLVFAAAALAAGGRLHIHRPAEALLLFANTFSSPVGVAGLFIGLPPWALPLALVGLHYAMVFRGLLFKELTAGAGSARLRAFKASLRR
jgi:hypothetical protein